MPKKEDRFDRIARKNIEQIKLGAYLYVSEPRVAKLLRAEYAWMWGCIKAEESRVKFGDSADYRRGAEAMVFALLKRLGQRRK